MIWEPRLPLTAAERHVDFPQINSHIDERRALLERMALPTAKRLAYVIVEFHGLDPRGVKQQLATVLAKHLQATARFGYQHARSEITQLRARESRVKAKLRPKPKLRPGFQIRDAGRHSKLARQGLDGMRILIAMRASETADAVDRAAATYAAYPGPHEQKVAAAATAASRVLHNRVLELVGETMNMGRTAGALSLAEPPEFALRSEQLDKTTCDACTEIHGEISQVDTNEYYALLPPAGCYGAGRCRGVMVFADRIEQVRQPEPLAA